MDLQELLHLIRLPALCYVDPLVGAVEIGYVDGVRNGQFDTSNNPSAALKVHFYPDATVPNTSDLKALSVVEQPAGIHIMIG